MSRLVLTCAASALLLAGCATSPGAPTTEVFLLVGQSNMSGRGQGLDPDAALGADARIQAWDPRTRTLQPARDPLAHQDLGQKPVAVGPGISFARAWLEGAGAQQRVLLVPAAFGGTGFSDAAGSWRVDGPAPSPLVTQALARANAAMQAVPGARFAGILWHQGETDGAKAMDAAAYGAQLEALAAYLRAHVSGASPSTPFVVGQYVPSQIQGSPALAAIAGLNATLPTRLAHSACVASSGLRGNPAPDSIHFDAASARELGRRYAAAMRLAQAGQGQGVPCGW